MDRKKHLIDCGAFLVMFLYGNAAIISYKLEAENLNRLE